MDIFDYLTNYSDKSFKEMAFNEVDALLLVDFSYIDFYELGLFKEKVTTKELLEKIDDYVITSEDSERKIKYLKLGKEICISKRFKDAYFAHYKKIKDHELDKQFQAVSIIFKDFIFISYCGTDSSVVGWKENFNMAIYETIASEIEAGKYVNMVNQKHPFKKIYMGGHSKGGRLAISAAKQMENKNKLIAVFSFDAPNYPISFYDYEYKQIDNKIIAFAPTEAIIGRLMNEYHPKRVIRSSNKLLLQHDTFSWLIDDYTFVYDFSYEQKSTRIVNTINNVLLNYSIDDKKLFIDFICSCFDTLGVEKLPNENVLLPFLISKLPTFYKEYKNSDVKEKEAIKKIAIELLKDYFLN